MSALTEDIPLDPATLIRLGVIASVDLQAARCTVRCGDPEEGEMETPAIRWIMPRCGDTRIWSPPTVGEQVVLLCPDGEIGAAVALTGITRDSFPALGSTLQERIDFADGAQLRYDPEAHHLEALLPDGATATITAPAGLTINAEAGVTINGDVTLNGTLTATEDVVAAGISLKSHKHGGTQPGGGQTGTPV
ncbi:phage baseplate assembly protein V [Sphingomonas ursincola]|uniref:phage baseplate assembly protein V n=1 Tax=Sphingomonas ursincola TaxID=56361 RepID=UPI0030CA45DB